MAPSARRARRHLPVIAPACPRCAGPAPAGLVCGRCLSHPPHYDATLAAFSYAFPVDALVQAFKYGGNHAAGRFLAGAVARRLDDRAPPDLVLPMPLAPARLRERGFNQAMELARSVARALRVPLAAQACRRVRETPPLAQLPWAERAKSVRDAFVCDHGRGRPAAGDRRRCDDHRRDVERTRAHAQARGRRLHRKLGRGTDAAVLTIYPASSQHPAMKRQ